MFFSCVKNKNQRAKYKAYFEILLRVQDIFKVYLEFRKISSIVDNVGGYLFLLSK